MDPMQPVELRGAMVTIRPLGVDDAEGILAAADSDEVFAWLPYPRPLDLAAARAWITDAIADRRALRRHPLAVIDSQSGSVIGSTSYWDFDSSRGQVEIGSTGSRGPAGGPGRTPRRNCSCSATHSTA